MNVLALCDMQSVNRRQGLTSTGTMTRAMKLFESCLPYVLDKVPHKMPAETTMPSDNHADGHDLRPSD
jgi:hypothetical protein